VVSAEQLTDALWGDEPPASATKVVQGCIARLRKILGADAIETTAQGYRLTVDHDDLDARRFERLLSRGRELLSLGQPERAAHVLGEATELWQGDPLREIEDWDPGRIEAERLQALRTEAEELRIEAALRAGRHLEVLATAQGLVAAEPLREQRWGLLARAEYQSGRQAEALRTLRRARAMLATEAGLDPGPDLVALEDAILHQDPTLTVDSIEAEPSETCPYPGLVAYGIDDRDGFFGRESETAACLHRLRAEGVLAVVGPSGSGKSSLLRAGVAASLAAGGRGVVVVTPGRRPSDALAAFERSAADAVLVVDQFEEAVTLCEDDDERTDFFDRLAALAESRDVAIALRADRLGEVSVHRAMARHLERGMFLLGAMSPDGLRSAIEGPARQAGLLFEPGLVELLLREIEGQPGALPLLSHALRQTWEQREGRTLTVAGYNETGGMSDALARSAERLFTSFDPHQQPLVRDVMMRLVVLSGDREPVRSPVPVRVIAGDQDRMAAIRVLADARLVTSDGDKVELAHEAITRAWPRFRTWLDEDIDGQRIRRHLTLASDEWDQLSRPDSELYRGVRLSAAVEWADRAAVALTGLETDFLQASQETAEREERTAEQRAAEQARRNRQLRLLLAGAVVLLVVALGAGVLLLRESDRANAAATRADARRVGAQALVTEDADRSLLLAVEGVRLDDSADTRDNLRATLARNPLLVASGRTPGPSWFIDVSPSGDRLFVSGGHPLAAYATDGIQPMVDTDFEAVALEISPNGTVVAAADDDIEAFVDHERDPFPVRLFDLTTLDPLPPLVGQPDDANTFSIGFSGDGRRLAAVFQHLDYERFITPFGSIRVWDVDRPGDPPQIIEIRGEEGVPDGAVLNQDGSIVYVTSVDPPVTYVAAYDVDDGRLLASVETEPSFGSLEPLALSPDGDLLAVTEGFDLVLRRTTDLSEVTRFEGHEGWIFGPDFSHDGKLVATASEDGTVKVWDVANGEMIHDLTGHSGPVRGVAFGPADRILYSSGLDQAILAWDLAGDRRFAPLIAPAGINAVIDPDVVIVTERISPDGQTAAYLQLRIEDETPVEAGIQFLDLETGDVGEWLDAGHVEWGAGAWDPRSARFATTGRDGTVVVWDVATLARVASREVADGHIAGIGFTDDGSRIIVGERSGRLLALDAETLEPVGSPVDTGTRVTEVFAGPESLAVALLDQGFVLADLGSGQVLFEDTSIGVWGSGLSSNGTRLAVGTNTGEVGLLDIERAEWIVPPKARTVHRAAIARVSFSPDGSRFATGSRDGRVGVFDATTGRPEISFPDLFGPWAMPYFEPDGRAILVSALEGLTPGVYRWDLRPDAELDTACAIAGRNLTEDEWRDAFGDRQHRATCPNLPVR
jgi:WD40 repeat protein/DNA-binding SARP family transcriptional activator